MKKLISLMAALAVCAVLAGCGEPQTNPPIDSGTTTSPPADTTTTPPADTSTTPPADTTTTPPADSATAPPGEPEKKDE